MPTTGRGGYLTAWLKPRTRSDGRFDLLYRDRVVESPASPAVWNDWVFPASPPPPSGDPLVFEGSAFNTSPAASTNTFSSFPISAAEASNRWIIVAAAPIRDSATTVTGVTIGGNAATPLSSFTGNGDLACRWYAANVPTGTSVTITVTCDGSTWECVILVWSIGREPVVYDAETSTSAPSELASVSIDVPAGGDVIAFAGYRGGGSSSNYFAWTGATESSDARLFADKTYSSAEEIGLSAQTGRTVSAQLQNSTYYIQPLISVLTLEAGAGGAETVSVPATSYSVTAPGPEINISTEVEVPATSITVSAPGPEISLSEEVSVPATAYTVSAPAPEITIEIEVAVPATTFSVTAPAPEITVGENVDVPATSYTLSAPAPAIDITTEVSVPATSISVSAPAPEITVGENVDVPATTYSVSAPAPTITETIEVSVPASSYELSFPEPVIGLVTTVIIPATDITVTAPAPTFDFFTTVSVPATAISVVVPPPDIGLSNIPETVIVTGSFMTVMIGSVVADQWWHGVDPNDPETWTRVSPPGSGIWTDVVPGATVWTKTEP